MSGPEWSMWKRYVWICYANFNWCWISTVQWGSMFIIYMLWTCPRWYSMPVSSLASLRLWLIISDAGNIVKNHIMNNLSVGRLNPQRHYSEGKWMGRGKAERRKRRTMSLPNLANQQQEGVGLCETQLECAKQDLILSVIWLLASDISYKWLFQRLG